MTQATTAVKKLADQDVWIEAAYIAGGFFGPTVAENVTEGLIPYDVPSEAYGLAAMAAEYKFLTGTQRSRTMGGSGLFVFDALLERTGYKQTVEQLGGS